MKSTVTKVCVVCGREFPEGTQRCPEDDVILSESDPLVGTVLDDKYQILSFVGVGGMSRVYKAKHIDLNRDIAIKFLKSSERIDLQRFRREAVSVNQLNHHNIARVFSFSVSSKGKPYLAMEYLEGKSLATIMAGPAPLTVAESIDIVEQIASGLAHAHNLGIVHRDIKPANIVLTHGADSEPIAKIVDFGMARLSMESGAQKLTQTGEIFGTRQYISPEQYKGISADNRADIFSLGMLLYELVSREMKVPAPLAPVLEKALAPEPEHRYQSMIALQDDLHKIGTIESDKVKYVNISPEWTNSRQDFWNWYLLSICAGLCCLILAVLVMVRQAIHPTTAPYQNKGSSSIKSALSGVPVGFESLRIRTNELILSEKLNDAEAMTHAWQESRSKERPLTLREQAGTLALLGHIEFVRGDFQRALPLWQAAVKWYERQTGELNYSDLIEARHFLASTELELRLADQAAATIKKTLDLIADRGLIGSSMEIEQKLLLARAASLKGNIHLAEKIYFQCCGEAKSGDMLLPIARRELAAFYLQQERNKDALVCLRLAVEEFKNCGRHGDALLADTETELGRIYVRENKLELARAALEDAWHKYAWRSEVFSRHMPDCAEALSKVYRLSGETAKAEELDKKTRELKQQINNEGIRSTAKAH